MDWGDIQIEVLKKMFLNNEDINKSNLNSYKEDRKYKTYLFGMPQAANEGLQIICSLGKPLIKSYTLKRKSDNHKYLLPTIIGSSFKRLYEIVYDGSDKPEWYIEGNNVLVINKWTNSEGTITIYYEAYPNLITSSSSSSTNLGLDRELTVLLVLYIASELYKDDDISMATMWRNEFEQAIQNIRDRDFNPAPRDVTTVYDIGW